MAWYWVALIVLGGYCCVLGLCLGVYYTDELMGPSPEVLPTLQMWLMCAVLGPITVAVWLIYIAIKAIIGRRKAVNTPQQKGT